MDLGWTQSCLHPLAVATVRDRTVVRECDLHYVGVAMALRNIDPERTRIRVLIADEQPLFRDAIRVFLEREEDLLVVGEAADGPSAVAEAVRTAPDVAVVPCAFVIRDGIRTTSLMLGRVPRGRVLVLDAEEDAAALLDAIEAGASGYLTKQSSVAELAEAIRAVHRKEISIPLEMVAALISGLIGRRREQERTASQVSALTRREREVLLLLAEGVDTLTVSHALGISPQTVRTHVQNILGKLQLHSRLEAVAYARRSRILHQLIGSRGQGHRISQSRPAASV